MIDISEEDYAETMYRKQYSPREMDWIDRVIANGTPLPKGHGRLIDADALEGHRQIQIVPCGNGKYVEVMTYYQNDLDGTPTIIEADSESGVQQ